MSLHLTELGVEHDRVFMDTGWERPATYEYLRGPLTEKLGPIVEVGRPGGMVQLVRDKKMFAGRIARFCTEELKLAPMKAYIQGHEHDVVNAVGVRAAESLSRAKLTPWEWSSGLDCEVWRPVLRWTFDDVVAIHRRHALEPNPLYALGAERVGCWPCIFARKDEIRLLAEMDPARIAEIAALETELDAGQAIRAAAKGVPVKRRPTFFSRPEFADGVGHTPIARAVEWSRTAHGGNQFELFHDPSNAGCMRWGMCDTGDDKEDAE